MASESTTTTVEIFGSTYHVRGDNDRDYLRELAGIVDRKMREIAEHVATVDTAKVAILAAVNLADELSQAKKSQEGERVEIQQRVEALSAQLAHAVEP